jgi:hypothetical protein
VSHQETLVRIKIDLPGGEPYHAETLWALPVGGELYELRNSPFYAFDLNWGDTVRCHAVEDELPTAREVVRRSGHKTLRILFDETLSEDRRQSLLGGLDEMSANHEHAVGRLYAIDVRPEADYQAVCDFLFSLEQEDVLTYETGASSSTTLGQMDSAAPD